MKKVVWIKIEDEFNYHSIEYHRTATMLKNKHKHIKRTVIKTLLMRKRSIGALEVDQQLFPDSPIAI